MPDPNRLMDRVRRSNNLEANKIIPHLGVATYSDYREVEARYESAVQ